MSSWPGSHLNPTECTFPIAVGFLCNGKQVGKANPALLPPRASPLCFAKKSAILRDEQPRWATSPSCLASPGSCSIPTHLLRNNQPVLARLTSVPFSSRAFFGPFSRRGPGSAGRWAQTRWFPSSPCCPEVSSSFLLLCSWHLLVLFQTLSSLLDLLKFPNIYVSHTCICIHIKEVYLCTTVYPT